MDISDLRLAALKQASDDTRTFIAGAPVHASPEVIRTRAQAYMDFLLGAPDRQPPKAKKKR